MERGELIVQSVTDRLGALAVDVERHSSAMWENGDHDLARRLHELGDGLARLSAALEASSAIGDDAA